MRFVMLVVLSLVLGCRERPAQPPEPPPEPLPPPAQVAAPKPVPVPVPERKREPDELRIRLKNKTGPRMERITVRFRAQEEHYDSLAAGAVTEYRTVASSYRYGFVELFIRGERHVLQPVDFVGEKLLPPGDYTWVLSLEEYGLHLKQEQP